MKYPVEKVLDRKYIRVFDIQYKEGKHYYDSSRRDEGDLMALHADEAVATIVPDAVSCEVVLERDGEEPLLLMAREFRYPVGRFLLSPPAGLIDEEDRALGRDAAIRNTAIRELKEETGVTFKEGDRLDIINPLLLSSPGMTDECNAMVRMVIYQADEDELTQEGGVGSELFDGFELLTLKDAERVMINGCDDSGVFYSTYTWIALSDFIRNYGKEK